MTFHFYLFQSGWAFIYYVYYKGGEVGGEGRGVEAGIHFQFTILSNTLTPLLGVWHGIQSYTSNSHALQSDKNIGNNNAITM